MAVQSITEQLTPVTFGLEEFDEVPTNIVGQIVPIPSQLLVPELSAFLENAMQYIKAKMQETYSETIGLEPENLAKNGAMVLTSSSLVSLSTIIEKNAIEETDQTQTANLVLRFLLEYCRQEGRPIDTINELKKIIFVEPLSRIIIYPNLAIESNIDSPIES